MARHRRLPPCSVIPYGAPLLEHAPAPAALSEWNLVSGQYHLVVCRLEPENHVREIIEGFTAYTDGRYPLVIVGNQQTGAAYVQDLCRLASDRVRFIGTVYNEKLLSLRYHARAYLPWPLGRRHQPVVEAMGAEIVVAHDNVFNREVIGAALLVFSQCRRPSCTDPDG